VRPYKERTGSVPEGWETIGSGSMRILLVEDDTRTASFVSKGLCEEGYVVDRAADGEAGLLQMLTNSYDGAIVDIMMPGLDGVALVERARASGVAVPVLFLSARSLVEDRVRGLRAGGDDYLTKPFAFSELAARVEALLRRDRAGTRDRTLRVGDLELDLQRRRVHRGSVEIRLQPLELALLEYLMRNAGRVVSRTMIAEQVWNYNFNPETNVVETRICRLREKIDKPFDVKLIRTIRGCGYVLEHA